MSTRVAQKWLKQAKHDLEMAERNIAIGGYDVAAFLAHQSVEKLLKSIYAAVGRDIPRTHYIDEIATDLGIEGETLSQIVDLTADYMFARYPDVADRVPYEQYDKSISEAKVLAAKKVFAALLEQYGQVLDE